MDLDEWEEAWAAACPGPLTIEEPQGVLLSPGYPYAHYPNNKDCTVKLEAPAGYVSNVIYGISTLNF